MTRPPAIPTTAFPDFLAGLRELLNLAWRLVWLDGVWKGAVGTTLVLIIVYLAADLARRPRA